MRSCLLVLMAILLIGCAHPQPRRSGTSLSPEELAACKAKGGRPEQARYTLEICALPTTDAGKPCQDKAGCQGFCEAPWGAAPDAVVTGTCSKESQSEPTGCFNHVREGKATGEWCFH
jgi:hypothetical protein